MANRQINIENVTMKEILISMRRLGGQVTRREICSDIRDNSTAISEQEVNEVKVSKKTGNKYKPFDYTFNYAVMYLVRTGFLTEDDHQVELSEKGRKVNLDIFNPEKDVRPFLEDNNSQELKKKSLSEIDSAKDSTDEVTEEDQWRQDLLDALMKMSPKKFESNVPAPEIDKFRGAMDKYNAEFGIFITNSDFTRGAIKTAREGTRIITLIDGDEICDLVAKYNYYVEPVTTYRLKSFYTDKD